MGKKRGMPVLVSSHGRIRNNDGFKYFPNPRKDGYCALGIAGSSRKSLTLLVHRVVHIIFNDPELRFFQKGDTVDHIISYRSMNNRENLRWASPSKQRENQDQPSHRGTDVRYRITSSKFDRLFDFGTQNDATEFMKVDNSLIKGNEINQDELQKLGWEVVVLDNSHFIEGEEWKYPTPSSKSKVSSLGRIETAYGKRYYPRPDRSGYVYFRWNGVSTQVSHLVMMAFGFSRPSSMHSIDHKDRNPGNNSITNLRWANATEQNRNKGNRLGKSFRKVEVKLTSSSVWKLYKNSNEAREVLGISLQAANNCLNPCTTHKTAGGNDGLRYNMRFQVQEDLLNEEWLEVKPEEWDVGGRYYSIAVC